jgi:hypothetical protein
MIMYLRAHVNNWYFGRGPSGYYPPAIITTEEKNGEIRVVFPQQELQLWVYKEDLAKLLFPEDSKEKSITYHGKSKGNGRIYSAEYATA